jgi:zinc transporter ZupT
MGGVWILYSIAHLLHLGHHEHEIDSHDCASSRSSVGFGLFFGSLAAHCFASGLLLSVSHGLSARIAGTVFAALFAHKAYESLLFTSILLEQRRSRLWKGMMVAAYALALPVGVAAASLFGAHLHQQVAVLISSIAVGTLLGCLLFDFLIPSLRQIESLRYKAGWILFGLALTRVVMLRL